MHTPIDGTVNFSNLTSRVTEERSWCLLVRVHTDRDTRVPQDVCCASVPGAEPVPSLISRARSVMVPSLSGRQMSTATGVEAKTEMAAPHASGAAR